VTNPKIEKVKGEIAKTKARMAQLQVKLREQEHLKTKLENDEVVAMFRKEKLSEEEFAALLHVTQNKNGETAEEAAFDVSATARESGKEEISDVNNEE